MANVLCHALALANPKTPEGVKQALERVRNLPAATGGPENYISFGPWDHRGYTGPDYVLHRTVRGGKTGSCWWRKTAIYLVVQRNSAHGNTDGHLLNYRGVQREQFGLLVAERSGLSYYRPVF